VDRPTGALAYDLYGQSVQSDLRFVTIEPAGTSQAGIEFQSDGDPIVESDLDTLAPLYESAVRLPDGRSAGSVLRVGGCDVLRIAGAGDFWFHGRRIVCHRHPDSRSDLVELVLLGTGLAYWHELSGIPALHASAVVVADKAIVFLAGKHAGKSSLAASFVGAGWPLLTDDVLVVEPSGDEALARPGYPSMRLWPAEARHFTGSNTDHPRVLPTMDKRRVLIGGSSFGTFCGESRSVARISPGHSCHW